MKYLTLAILLTLSTVARSQKEFFYAFDGNWNSIEKLEKAIYFLHTHKINDTCWQFDYYNFKGPMMKSEQFRNKDGKVINGYVRYFNSKGLVDSTGTYHNGKKEGDFVKLEGDSLKWKWKYTYHNDSLVEVIDIAKLKKDTAVKYNDEKESEFPDGAAGWARYLQKNLKYPDRAVNFNSQGQVCVDFIIDRDGRILDSDIAASVEYSLDEEALRIIRKSGKWEPAFQNGHTVKSYKRQPINFRLEVQ